MGIIKLLKIFSRKCFTLYICKDKMFSTSTIQQSGKESLKLARLMGPDDANIKGNVHGGTILKLIEEAGMICATRHCNSPENKIPCVEAMPVLARLERMDFSEPMYLGEIAQLYAEVTFTAYHSMNVLVHVYAENPLKGQRRLTNTANLWYVPVSAANVDQVLSVPPLSMTETQAEKGWAAYNHQQKQRVCTVLHLADTKIGDPKPHTVGHSSTILSKLINPSDIVSHGYCGGGVIMKLMDECAAIVAGKHCGTNTVTASVDATNFLAKNQLGALLTVHGVVTFTGTKSLEVQVLVDAEYPFQINTNKYRAVESFFTFVSLDNSLRTLPVPPLKIRTAQENSRFNAGKQRYEDRKQQRKTSTVKT